MSHFTHKLKHGQIKYVFFSRLTQLKTIQKTEIHIAFATVDRILKNG